MTNLNEKLRIFNFSSNGTKLVSDINMEKITEWLTSATLACSYLDVCKYESIIILHHIIIAVQLLQQLASVTLSPTFSP